MVERSGNPGEGRQYTLPSPLAPTTNVMEAMGLEDPHHQAVKDESGEVEGGMLVGDKLIGKQPQVSRTGSQAYLGRRYDGRHQLANPDRD